MRLWLPECSLSADSAAARICASCIIRVHSNALQLTVADLLRTPTGVTVDYCQVHSFTYSSDWTAFVPVFEAKQLVIVGQYVHLVVSWLHVCIHLDRNRAAPVPENAPPHAFIHKLRMMDYATCTPSDVSSLSPPP